MTQIQMSTVTNLNECIDTIIKKMSCVDTKEIPALAKALRDMAIARAVLILIRRWRL